VDDTFRVATWVVQPSLNSLSLNGTSVHVEPKVMGVLVCLASRPGEIFSKESILKAVWQDTFVSEGVLTRSISELRRVFQDDARESRIIETIPKRGYRLVAEVSRSTGPASHSVPQPSASPRKTGRRSLSLALLVAAAALILASLSLALLRERRFQSTPAVKLESLAVLPLQNLSGDPADEYFADAMTEALTTDLAQNSSLKVISRTSSMQYKQTKKSLPEIARELHVDGVIEGSVQRSGGQVRITAQLIQSDTDRHLWAKSYARDMRDLLTLETEVSDDIAHSVSAQLKTAEGTTRVEAHPIDPRALEAYLQADYHLDRFGKRFRDEEKRMATRYLEQAIAADPGFVPAYVKLVRAHSVMFPDNSDLPAQIQAAEKAVALDPNSSDAHVVLGDVRWARGRWSEALEQFRMAVELNPSSAVAHDSLGNILDIVGPDQEALQEHKIAQQLDPRGDHLSWALYLRRDYDRAIEILLRFRESEPDNADYHWRLAQNYLQKKMYKQWVTEVSATMTLYGYPGIASRMQSAIDASGSRAALQQWAKELEQLIASRQLYLPGVLAQAYAIQGQNDRAFACLERAFTNRDRTFNDPYLWGRMTIDPGFASLRSDPRYADLLRRLGLPPRLQ